MINVTNYLLTTANNPLTSAVQVNVICMFSEYDRKYTVLGMTD